MKYWYAVLSDDEDNDWGTGSFDRIEAEKMLAKYPYGQIAVIDGGYDEDGNPTSDPICVEVIDRKEVYCPTVKTVSAIVVDCSDWGLGEFNVLIVPSAEITEKLGRPGYNFYLRHPKYSLVLDMFGCAAEDEGDAAYLAYHNAPDYIPDYIDEVGMDD